MADTIDLTKPISVQDDTPQIGAAKMNEHDHSGGIGKPIPTSGIKDLAVTTEKIAPGAITGDKMAENSTPGSKISNYSLSADKFEKGILNPTSDAATVGFANYRCSGLDIHANGGLNLGIDSGRFNIKDIFNNAETASILTLDAIKASLVYLQKSVGSAMAFGKVDAVFPTPDINTLFFYDFSKADMTNGKITDTGGYVTDGSLDLVFKGTTANVKKLQGWSGYGLTTDTTCYLSTAASAFKYDLSQVGKKFHVIMGVYFKQGNIVTVPLCVSGTGSTAKYIQIRTDASNSMTAVVNGNTIINMNYILQNNKFYVFDISYDGDTLRIGCNGRVLYKIQSQNFSALAVTTSTVWFGGDGGTTANVPGSMLGNGMSVLQFAWMRNDVLSEEDICRMCAKMLIPVDFSDYDTKPPALAETKEFHAWAMDEENGNIVADTGGNGILLNGTATNCDIISSKYGMGKARRFRQVDSSHYSQISLGNYALPNTFAFFTAIEVNARGRDTCLLDNRYSNSGMTLKILSDNTLYAYNFKTGIGKSSTTKIEFEKLIIIGFVFAGGGVYIYSDSEIPEFFPGITVDPTLNPLMLGSSPTYPAEGLIGDMHHAFMLTRVPTPEEIHNYFNIMKNRANKITTDIVLPEDSIALGLVRTNESTIMTLNKNPLYRSQNPFTDTKKKWCGWQWGSLSKMLYWDNPFGVENVRCTFYYKRNLWDDRVCQIFQIFSGGLYGVVTKDIDCETIKVACGQLQLCWGATTLGVDNSYAPAANNDPTVGWIGLLVEVVEDGLV